MLKVLSRLLELELINIAVGLLRSELVNITVGLLALGRVNIVGLRELGSPNNLRRIFHSKILNH